MANSYNLATANSLNKTAPTEFNSHHDDPSKVTWQFWKKRRYIVVIMAFFGFFNVYSLRVNLSVAIVAMVEIKNVTLENGTVIQQQYFDWNSTQQGYILSAFFYGYILTQFAGGYLADKIGGHLVFGLGIGTTALLTLLTPVAANAGYGVIIAIRVIEGIFEGVTFPCIHNVWSKWAPPMERSRMATMAFAGNYAGTVIAMPTCGLLADALGWESLFYVFGVIGLIWFGLWVLIVRESPAKDRFCSQNETDYIQESLGNQAPSKAIKHPWKAIFTSTAVYAIIASHFSENWGFYTLLTQLPTFLKDIFGFELNKTGFLSAVPYLVMGILLIISGNFADWLRTKGYLTTTQVRRYFNCTAFLAQTVFMVVAAYILEPIPSIICITIAVGLGAFAWCGFAVNHLDIAPPHAGILMGISNTFATIPGILSPTITGYIVQTKSADEWRIVFYISASIYLVGCIIYWFWASGEVQPWSMKLDDIPSEHEKDNGENGTTAYVNKALEIKE